MKKILTLLMAVAVILSTIPFTLLTPMTAYASDGGETSFHITAPSDDSTVRGDRDVTIRWTSYPNAVKIAITVKDMETGARPLEIQVTGTGTSYTVKADTVFTEDNHTYKIYCAALNSAGEVLSGKAAWESIYVTCEYPRESNEDQPVLIPSPSLTSPKVDVEYDEEVGCYVGISSKTIFIDEDLIIRWEDVNADVYSISAIILSGKPAPGYSEAKLVQLANKEHTTKNKFTFNREDLEKYGGRYLKIAVQALNDDGTYSLLSMFYLRIDVEPEPEPEENIVIDGVDIGYKVGDFFTKNGKACTSCHTATDVNCVANGSKCNCLRYVVIDGRTIDLKSVQCYGFARYIQMMLYDEHDGMTDTDFSKILTKTKASVQALKDADLAPGTHIRTLSSVKGYAHSIVIAKTTSSEVTIVDCNNKGTCNVDLRVMSWDALTSLINAYGGIEYVSVRDNGSTPTPTPVGTLTLSVGNVTGAPGETVKVPIRVTANPGCGYIRLKITSDLPVNVTNGDIFSHMTVGTTTIFYADTTDVKKTGDLAYLTVTIPANAADDQIYRIQVEAVECYNMAEDTLEVNKATGQIQTVTFIRCDVTGDREVDGRDLLRLVSFLSEQDIDTGLSPVQISRKGADVNGDGEISGKDVVALLAVLAST